MGTRSTINLLKSDGSIKSIYCHWDGYPSHNGKILLENYNTLEKVEALLNLGDLSSLEPSIDKPEDHSFDKPAEGYCVAYGRDRGEKNCQARTISSKRFFRRFAQEYNYFFDENLGKWFYDDHEKNYKELIILDCVK